MRQASDDSVIQMVWWMGVTALSMLIFTAFISGANELVRCSVPQNALDKVITIKLGMTRWQTVLNALSEELGCDVSNKCQDLNDYIFIWCNTVRASNIMDALALLAHARWSRTEEGGWALYRSKGLSHQGVSCEERIKQWRTQLSKRAHLHCKLVEAVINALSREPDELYRLASKDSRLQGLLASAGEPFLRLLGTLTLEERHHLFLQATLPFQIPQPVIGRQVWSKYDLFYAQPFEKLAPHSKSLVEQALKRARVIENALNRGKFINAEEALQDLAHVIVGFMVRPGGISLACVTKGKLYEPMDTTIHIPPLELLQLARDKSRIKPNIFNAIKLPSSPSLRHYNVNLPNEVANRMIRFPSSNLELEGILKAIAEQAGVNIVSHCYQGLRCRGARTASLAPKGTVRDILSIVCTTYMMHCMMVDDIIVLQADDESLLKACEPDWERAQIWVRKLLLREFGLREMIDMATRLNELQLAVLMSAPKPYTPLRFQAQEALRHRSLLSFLKSAIKDRMSERITISKDALGADLMKQLKCLAKQGLPVTDPQMRLPGGGIKIWRTFAPPIAPRTAIYYFVLLDPGSQNTAVIRRIMVVYGM